MARGDYGFNAQISAPGFGSRRVRATKLEFGLGIISTSDAEARERRAYYSIVTTGSSFTIEMGFVSVEERDQFSRWMKRFMVAVSRGDAKSGFQTIQVPSKKFTRVAVPEGDLAYGDGVKDVAYTVRMSYMGASDPLDLNLSQKMAGVSYFKGPKHDAESRYFYPAGRQVSGAESLDGTIFDPSRTPGSTYLPGESGDRAEDFNNFGIPGV